MRFASLLSMLSGIFFFCFAVATPMILRWQAENLLSQYGASEHVDLVVRVNLERLGHALIITEVVMLCLISSAAMMYRRVKLGLYLTLGILVLLVCIALWDSIGAETPALLVFKGFCWAMVFYIVLRAHRKHGATWWKARNEKL